MPATTDSPSSFLGRISIRRNQVITMDGGSGNHDQELEDLEFFQKHVSDRFADLLSPTPVDDDDQHPSDQPPFLSIQWLRKLLDVFLCIEAQFKTMIIMGRDPSQIAKPPLDRLVSEFQDRAVKALDICNAVMFGLDSVRHFQKLAEIAVTALQQRPIGDGQVKRAKKALNSLLNSMSIEDHNKDHAKSAERNKSFGRRATGSCGATVHKERSAGHFRYSWSMAKGWSAARLIQALSTNLVPPRGGESSGLALPVYITSTVMVFAMWALVMAVPCQERSGLPTHFPVPRQLAWAHSMLALQEKIAEQWKIKEKKGSVGLLEEMQRMEKLAQSLIEFADSFVFPTEGEKLEEVSAQVSELSEICRRMEQGLSPLQEQIREVFHWVVRSRTEILDVVEQGGKLSQPVV